MSQRLSLSPVSSSDLSAGRDGIGELELLVQQARIGLDMPRLVHHLGRGVELAVEIGHGLHDLGGGDQRALLAMHELRDRRGLLVVADLDLLLVGQPVPDIGAEDRDGTVVELHRVLGIEILRPVDAQRRVPLLLLALVVELQQRLAPVIIFPGEAGLDGALELPLRQLDWQRIAIHRRHARYSRLSDLTNRLLLHPAPAPAGARTRSRLYILRRRPRLAISRDPDAATLRGNGGHGNCPW